MSALVGPVRQVVTLPMSAIGMETRPLAAAARLTPGRCPAARSTATPCPFWTMTTVIANGITSSIMAPAENAGAVNTGAATSPSSRIPEPRRPAARATAVPTTAATATGGATAATLGTIPRATKTMIIGRAMRGSPVAAVIRSRPKRRKMPATMAMTIVGGRMAMIRPMSPVHPRRNTRTPVAR